MQGIFYATVAEKENRVLSTIPTSRDSDRFMLRLPDGMRDRIRAAAEANARSMNAEIIATLEKTYPAPIDPHFEELLERAMRIAPEIVTRAVEQVLQRHLDEGTITPQDIEDGLVPGVAVREDRDE